MNKYYTRFKGRTDTQLKQILGALMGNKNSDPRAIDAINMLLNNKEQDDASESESSPLHTDCAIAKSYCTKAKNSIDRGIEFDLSFSEYKTLKSKKRCFYTGIKFEADGLNKQTIDRIDSSKPYTKENSVSCLYQVNALKNALFESPSASINLTVDQMLKFISKLADIQ